MTFPVDQRSHCCRVELEPMPCPACDGSGAFEHPEYTMRFTCETCRGSGENKDMVQCSGCGTPYPIDDLRL